LIFDRRKKLPARPDELRAEYRHPLPTEHTLRMLIQRSDGSQIETVLVDLTARGAGFEAASDFELHEDEAVEVIVTCQNENWTVRTPAMARHRVASGKTTTWGVEFVNLGNLYGQWDNVLGQHFNRRVDARVTPELDRPVPVMISLDGREFSATLHDLSTRGMGLAVSHREVEHLEREARIEIAFKLPRCRREVRGTAMVRRNCHVGALNLVGVEFDLEAADGFVDHERAIVAYCKKRAKALSRWESAWEERAA